MTRIRITGSYGFAGTSFVEEYEVPPDIPPEEIESWAEEEIQEVYNNMCERLSCGYNIIHE